MSKGFDLLVALPLSFAVAIGIVWGCSAGGNPGPSAANPSEDALPPDMSPDKVYEDQTFTDLYVDEDAGRQDVFDPPLCPDADPNEDRDNDGWTVAQGDCNDCTELMNPGAKDYRNGVDDDCNGIVDDEPVTCDEGLLIDSDNAMDAARALGLCRVAEYDPPLGAKTWGVLSAKYVFPDGTVKSGTPKNQGQYCVNGGGRQGNPPHPRSHGILPSFGSKIMPIEGSSMLALSSGIARSGAVETSPGGAHMCTASNSPTGFPTTNSTCPGQVLISDKTAYDGIALELEIRVPTNALAFSFEFNFFTYEYPDYVCGQHNDFFVALMWPAPPTGTMYNNISFDSEGNAVSVNNGFLEVCNPGIYGGKQYTCEQTAAELSGTGFDGRGATGWLRTAMNLEPDVTTIRLRFAIWDMGDDGYDSTVLLDNFTWEIENLPPGTDRPDIIK